MSAAREAFVQNDAHTVREALTYLFLLAAEAERTYGLPSASGTTMKQRDDALAALDRLEELAT